MGLEKYLSGEQGYFGSDEVAEFRSRSVSGIAELQDTAHRAGMTAPFILRLADFRKRTTLACEELFAELAHGAVNPETDDALEERFVSLMEGFHDEHAKVIAILERAVDQMAAVGH